MVCDSMSRRGRVKEKCEDCGRIMKPTTSGDGNIILVCRCKRKRASNDQTDSDKR